MGKIDLRLGMEGINFCPQNNGLLSLSNPRSLVVVVVVVVDTLQAADELVCVCGGAPTTTTTKQDRE